MRAYFFSEKEEEQGAYDQNFKTGSICMLIWLGKFKEKIIAEVGERTEKIRGKKMVSIFLFYRHRRYKVCRGYLLLGIDRQYWHPRGTIANVFFSGLRRSGVIFQVGPPRVPPPPTGASLGPYPNFNLMLIVDISKNHLTSCV